MKYNIPAANFLLLLIFLYIGTIATAQLPAFPGAEGFGKHATGGRGGKVTAVTNLDDDGPGSLRQALNAWPGEPLTIVFSVSGVIELKSPLVLRRSNITIAGQTAPGEGICLKGNSFIINGAGKGGNKGNIIIRYIRSRPGSTLPKGSYGLDIENCHDIIIDHCSFSWANEECVAVYDVKHVTIQWCIISEGLYNAGHAKGNRAYGGVWGGQYASYHHNLFAHLNSRAVRFNGARAHDTTALVDYRNNVLYNWGNINACYGGDVKIPGGRSQVNMVNNYYKPGPATPDTLKFLYALYADNPSKNTGQWHINGNVMERHERLTKNNREGIDLSAVPEPERNKAIFPTPFEVQATVNMQKAGEAYQAVLQQAGATLPRRDATDTRIVTETRTGAASGSGSHGRPGIIDSPLTVGGWAAYKSNPAPADTDQDGIPDEWERKNNLNSNDPADGNKISASGYTNLEDYLNSLVTN